jgi:hypothetical protein
MCIHEANFSRHCRCSGAGLQFAQDDLKLQQRGTKTLSRCQNHPVVVNLSTRCNTHGVRDVNRLRGGPRTGQKGEMIPTPTSSYSSSLLKEQEHHVTTLIFSPVRGYLLRAYSSWLGFSARLRRNGNVHQGHGWRTTSLKRSVHGRCICTQCV